MGCSNSKVCTTITTVNCLQKLSKIMPHSGGIGIKEVYNLFIIVDFLPLKELVKVSRVSR